MGFNAYNTPLAGGNYQQVVTSPHGGAFEDVNNIKNIAPPLQQDFYVPRTVNSQENTLAKDPSLQFKQKTVKENEPSFLQKNWIPLTVGAVTLGTVIVAGCIMIHGKLLGKPNANLENVGNDFGNKGKDWIKYTIEELTTAKATAQGEDLDAILKELFDKYNRQFRQSKDLNSNGLYLEPLYSDREAGEKALTEAGERLKRHNDKTFNLTDEDLAQIHYEMGDLHYKLGNYEEAFHGFSSSNGLVPNNTDATIAMAITSIPINKPEKGVELLSNLLKFHLKKPNEIRGNRIEPTLDALARCMEKTPSYQELGEVVQALAKGRSRPTLNDSEKNVLQTNIGTHYQDFLHQTDESTQKAVQWVVEKVESLQP